MAHPKRTQNHSDSNPLVLMMKFLVHHFDLPVLLELEHSLLHLEQIGPSVVLYLYHWMMNLFQRFLLYHLAHHFDLPVLLGLGLGLGHLMLHLQQVGPAVVVSLHYWMKVFHSFLFQF